MSKTKEVKYMGFEENEIDQNPLVFQSDKVDLLIRDDSMEFYDDGVLAYDLPIPPYGVNLTFNLGSGKSINLDFNPLARFIDKHGLGYLGDTFLDVLLLGALKILSARYRKQKKSN